MLKKICLLLIFGLVLPNLAFVQAEEQGPKKEKAISILGKIVPKADENGYMVFVGQAKNNTEDLLNNVEVVFDVLDGGGKILDSTTGPVSGRLEGVLEGGETGNFEIQTKALIRTVRSYKYNITWNAFAESK